MSILMYKVFGITEQKRFQNIVQSKKALNHIIAEINKSNEPEILGAD